MNNYYTLIYLTEYINNKLENSEYQFSISPHRNVWEGYFERPAGDMNRLVFSTSPGETALFTDRYRPPKKSNVIRFFDSLEGEKVERTTLSEGDRLISIHFRESVSLQFQLFGNKANLRLVEDNLVADAFKNRHEISGKPAPHPRRPEKGGIPPSDISTKNQLLYVDRKFPRQLIRPVIEFYQLSDADPETIRDVVERLVQSMLDTPSYRVLTNGKLCLIPDTLLPIPNKKIFDNINEAVRYCYYKASRLRRFDSRIRNLRPVLEKSLKKSTRALQQIENAGKALERADKYETYGHLLMAHAHQEKEQGSNTLEVRDFYNNNEKTEIELKDNLSIAENAENYYERSAKAKRRVKESARRKKEILATIKKLEILLESLDQADKLYELEEWEKEHHKEMEELGLIAGEKQKSSKPWREAETGGYEIRIGKNARSNDKLTSGAHKEDIWLHARGAGGSHVVIRMQNKTGYPPKHVVRTAAAWAAYHSKLRGSELVPVIVTKRKYVTKPKGAPAGTVRVQREEVEIVTPKKI